MKRRPSSCFTSIHRSFQLARGRTSSLDTQETPPVFKGFFLSLHGKTHDYGHELSLHALLRVTQPDVSLPRSVRIPALLELRAQIGYPVLIRAAYALGGLGSGFAENEAEFKLQASKGFAYSDQLIVDQVSTPGRKFPAGHDR